MNPAAVTAAKRVLVIACGVLRLDIQHLVRESGLDPDTRFLEGGLHEKPRELRRQLQEAIDQASAGGEYARIVVGYGICGRGSVSLKARDIPLVIPRVHDCVALFLGGNRAYREQFRRFPGTYYISAGWQAEKTDPLSQKRPYIHMDEKRVYFDDLARQVGAAAARETFKLYDSWKKNYQRAAFIDTGAGSPGHHAQYAREMAAKHGWRYERIPGDTGLLRRMLSAECSGEDILVVPPGYVTVFDPLAGGLAASPRLAESAGDAAGETGENRESRGSSTSAREHRDIARIRIGLGIDAGGTYTDVVLFDLRQRRVLGKHKALTTKWDYTQGIGRALDGLAPDLLARVELVALSTTLATNAIVEGHGQQVGLLLMTPYGLSDPKEIPYEPKRLLKGALEISGRIKVPVDEQQVRRAVREMTDRHAVQAFAVSGFAGAINPTHEITVKRIVREETGCFTTCGHELSNLLNFKTRAETAVLNARIVPRLVKLLEDLDQVLQRRQVLAPVMVVKGDGSLMARSMAAERPVETILSGPAASVAGARFLTGLDRALVMDMGGTTTDTAVLNHGRVETDPAGSLVGKVKTHIRALKIRTCGLGGDSLIVQAGGEFSIGPRRVAPLAWLAHKYAGYALVMDELQRSRSLKPDDAQFLTVLSPSHEARDRSGLADQESRLLALLKERPYSIAASARALKISHPSFLPLSRLEENGLIQRCGFTPTDLLHVTGEFVRWDAPAARQAAEILADQAECSPGELVTRLKRLIIEQLAVELIKKQLEPDTDPEALDQCPVCRVLVDRLLGGNARSDVADYRVRFQMEQPVIGIGAPVSHFLPPAAELLGARALIPEHADVANAVGAITSHIRIRREVTIRPDENGGFYVEGLPHAPRFPEFDAADRFAREALVERVHTLARAAGTSGREVEIQHNDRTVRTSQGDALFLERILTARLSGRPDLSLADQVDLKSPG